MPRDLRDPCSPRLDTIETVKQDVTDQSAIPVADQKLFWQGSELIWPKSKLSDYGVENGTTLLLRLPMHVEVTGPNGSSYRIEVEPQDTIQNLKDKIATMLGIPAPKQVLVFGGKRLDHPRNTLAYCNIVDGSKLALMPLDEATPMRVVVHTPHGKARRCGQF